MNRTTEITETISSSCSLPLHEIVGGDLAARGDGDLLRRIAFDGKPRSLPKAPRR